MLDYKIIKTGLGFIITKEFEKDGVRTKLFWDGKKWNWRKDAVKTFLFQSDALSYLVAIKYKDGKKSD